MAEYDPNAESSAGIANLGISISDASEASGLRLSLNMSSHSHSHSQSRLTGSQQLFQSRGSLAGAASGFIQPGMGGIGVVIADSVYFCGEREVNHLPNVQLRRVSAFLAVAQEVQMPAFVKQSDLDCGAAAFEKLEMLDDHTTMLRRHFSKAFKFLDRCRANGHRVMIYCRQGQSRSASIAAAYVMRERKCNFIEALDHLRETRKADPNFLFCQQLDTYAREGHPSLSSSMAPTPQIGFVMHHNNQQPQHHQNAQHSATVSTASVATTGAESTPKGSSAVGSGGGSMSPETMQRATSGSPAAPKVSPPANQPPLPSFLVASGAFSVSVGDGAGLISFHSLDHPALGTSGPLNASHTTGGPILPYGRPGMGPAGASSSQEATGPLAVPADRNNNNPLLAGDTSSHAPPTVTSTAGGGGHAGNLSRMMEASLMTNPGAHDEDEDLIPQQDSRGTSQVEFPVADLMGDSAHTQLPPAGSASSSGPVRSCLPAPVANAHGVSGDDQPNFGRAHDILADSGVISADGQLLLRNASDDDDADE